MVVKTLSPQEIAGFARRATVQIRALDLDGRPVSAGTGFFVSHDGLVATNVHVIRGARRLQVETNAGEIFDLVYFVVADPRRDIAILKVPVDDVQPLSLAVDAALEVGAPVYVMGNPLGQVGTFSNGLVSAERTVEGVGLIQITAPVSPGSSGGPVMNANGDVIGVATFMLRGGQNLNYAVPARYVRPLARSADTPRPFATTMVPSTGGGLASLGQDPSTASSASASGAGAGSDLIGRQFHSIDSLLAGYGAELIGHTVRGVLAEGETADHPTSLAAGKRYIIAGYCDGGCADLDLALVGPDGATTASDVLADDHPSLSFEAPEGGRYILTVSMASCQRTRCSYGIRLYRL
jgi:S1-C subfamily serine protease